MNNAATPTPLNRLMAHRAWVRSVARAMVRDENDADDLEQGMWLEALQRPPRSETSLRAWFAAALRHDLADRRRSESARARRQETQARAEATPSADDLVAVADAHRRVVSAVMDLAEPYRSTILLRFFEELTPSEIAARQGVPTKTVDTRLRRALAQLRERFDAESGGDRSAWTAALVPLLHARHAGDAVGLGTGTAARAAEVMAMKSGTKLTVAALVVLVGGLVGWEFHGGPGRTAGSPPESPVAGVGTRGAADAAAAATGPDDVAATPAASRTSRSSTDLRTAADPRTVEDASERPDAAARARPPSAAPQPAAGAAAPPDAVGGTPAVGEAAAGKGGSLLGRVEGPAGAPAGAKVVAQAADSRVPLTRTCVTGPDGAYRFDDLPAGPYTLDVFDRRRAPVAEGRNASERGPLPRHAGVEVTVGGTTRTDFLADAWLSGRLTDSGTPMARAIVRVSQPGPPSRITAAWAEPDGTFRIDGLEPGESRVSVQTLDPPEFAVEVETRTIVAGENRADLRLGEGDVYGQVTGRILWTPTATTTNRPTIRITPLVEKAPLVWTAGPVAVVWASPDATGAYRVHGLRAGRYQMSVVPGSGSRPTTTEFDLAYGEHRAGLDVDLDAGPGEPEAARPECTLSGRVTYADGRPADAGSIGADEVGTGRFAAGAVGPSGNYRIERLEPGAWRLRYVLRRTPEFSAEVAETTLAAGANSLDLVVGAGEVTGRVHAAATGRPLAQGDVNLTLSVTASDGSIRYVGTAWTQVRTPDGAFRFSGVRSGTLRLVAWPLVGGLAPRAVDVDVAAGTPADVDLALPDAVTGTVLLVVRDQAGASVRQVVVESLLGGRPEQGSRVRRASATGVYEIALPSEPFALSLDSGQSPQSVQTKALTGTAVGDVRAGETISLEVVLRPAR